ncbi:enoyl-CoA hydratase [Prosthecomicrobium hirschii]|uniref:Enoyl-CoA hydratase domain-containing protein 3, mitochondrial n=1 Tax=Prosthecodimorpha hirschii TaxID=665126 RepID=A0A0P6VXH2_9HYPH|nr:enoyl-CoA hydratase [Prosthecomicrobium hirschii]
MLREHLADGVLRLTLDHAERRNALSEAMMAALQAALDRAAADPAVRVVVIGHAGPAFSAGHDLKELTARRTDADRGRAYFETVMKTCARLMTSVVRLPKPVIAEISGLATAAGCQLVASCDLAVAGEGARFATPGVHIGLFCSTPMVALSRNLAPKHAMEMLLTGETVDAATALRFGLVNRVVPAAELSAETGRLAATIAAKSPATLKIGKEAFYRQVEMDLDAAYAYTAGVMVDNMLIRDAEEGIGAFIEKRPPQWRGA